MYTYIYIYIYIHILSFPPVEHVSEVALLATILLYKMAIGLSFQIYMYTYIYVYTYISILSFAPGERVSEVALLATVLLYKMTIYLSLRSICIRIYIPTYISIYSLVHQVNTSQKSDMLLYKMTIDLCY